MIVVASLRTRKMIYQDKTLSCRDCQRPFLFSAGEQEFFAGKGLTNEPRRCPNCRVSLKMQKAGKDPSASAEIPCHDCGIVTRVPFKPTRNRPVYCPACFQRQRSSASQIAVSNELSPD